MSDASAPVPSSRTARLLLLVAVALAVFGAKLILIDRYGSDLPYWDQWDGEGEYLLKPYIEGHLTKTHFFRPHNEHRPVLTRLFSLALFELSGRQWDARVQVIANATLHIAFVLLLLGLAWRALPPLGAALFAGVATLFLASAVAWENTLGGFQSQFYFVLLFAALHIGGTLLAPPRSWRWWLAPLAGVAAVFSMASGLLSALAVIGATTARVLRERKLPRDDVIVLACNLPLVVAGLLLKAEVPGHAPLKAASVGVWLDAFLHQFSWPIISLWAAPIGLLPPLALALAWFRRRIDGPVALTLLGGATWFTLQSAASAYARGAESHGYASRYCDPLTIGVLLGGLALAYLAVTARKAGERRGWLVATGLFALAAVAGLAREVQLTAETTLRTLPGVNEARIAVVRHYLATRDPVFFQKIPWDELPFPSARMLAGYLDDPTMRPILAASVRPPLPVAPDPRSRGFNAYRGDRAPGRTPLNLPAWASDENATAQFTSVPFKVSQARLSLFVAGENPGATPLRLLDQQGRECAPLGSLAVGPRWKRINFILAPGQYRIEAAHQGPGWIAFTLPVTNTTVSHLALKLPRVGPALLAAAGLLAFASLILLAPPAPLHRGLAAGAVAGAGVIVALGTLTTFAGAVPEASVVDQFALCDLNQPTQPAARFAGAAFFVGPPEPGWYGTYIDGDRFAGTAVSTEFTLTSDVLQIPILGYPHSRANELALEILDAAHRPATVIQFDGDNPRENVGFWTLEVRNWRGQTARLRLRDGETGFHGWLAVRGPLRMNVMPAAASNVGTESLVLLGLAGLACAGFVLWRRGSVTSPAAAASRLGNE